MPTDDYLSLAVSEFKRLKKLADGALGQVAVEQLFHVGGAEDNRLAVMMKHMSGNMSSRWKDAEHPTWQFERIQSGAGAVDRKDGSDLIILRGPKGSAAAQDP